MPKDTFYNLPEEKRKIIENAAIDEFAEHGYKNASVNRIVKMSGIAKGSFYQYFGDKKDLFLYILSYIGDKKLEYLQPTMLNPEQHEFFTLIKSLYLSGIQFATENVKLAKIGNQILNHCDKALYNELFNENIPKANAVYENLIRSAQENGEIKARIIDIEYVSYMMTAMGVANLEYWMQNRNSFDINEYSQNVMDLVDRFLDILKNGIGTSKGGSRND